MTYVCPPCKQSNHVACYDWEMFDGDEGLTYCACNLCEQVREDAREEDDG